jgi:2-hydroxy-3-oxopropionate reductase
MTKKIAFLGTGLMGAPMAANLIAAGFSLSVWNRNEKKTAPLAALGASVAPDAAAAVEGADVTITMLFNGPIVTETLFERGCAERMQPGSLFIDMSSIAPALAREHGEKLGERDVRTLDAPVSGGTIGAKEATLAIMAGGARAAFDAATPVFEAMGTPRYIGASGSGQVAKLANQIIVAVTIGAVAEGLLFASAAGADAAAVRDALMGGYADSRILTLHGARMIDRDYRPGGPNRLFIKDLNTIAEAASAIDLDLPLVQSVREVYRRMIDQGLTEHDHASLLLDLEARNAPHRLGNGPTTAPGTKDAG